MEDATISESQKRTGGEWREKTGKVARLSEEEIPVGQGKAEAEGRAGVKRTPGSPSGRCGG